MGTHSTVLQLGHTTTVWLWLNTVVLQGKQVGAAGWLEVSALQYQAHSGKRAANQYFAEAACWRRGTD